MAIASAAQQHPGLTLIITNTSADALQLEEDIRFFGSDLDTLLFPDWETLPYDVFSPHQDIISQRIETPRKRL